MDRGMPQEEWDHRADGKKEVMKNKRQAQKSGFGNAVIESLTEFLDAADRGEPMTARRVKLNLAPSQFAPEDVKKIRSQLNVSQAMFAQLMAVSVKLVQAWEAGTNKPKPLACRLLDEIRVDPQGWLHRQFSRSSTMDQPFKLRQKHLIGK